jgi:hypothetical protein
VSQVPVLHCVQIIALPRRRTSRYEQIGRAGRPDRPATHSLFDNNGMSR